MSTKYCFSNKDCWGQKCDKAGSRIICTKDNGCACTLPISKKCLLALVLIVIISFIFFTNTREKHHGKSIIPPNFIPSDKFDGPRKGYVFKLDDDGRLGYHKDTHNQL